MTTLRLILLGVLAASAAVAQGFGTSTLEPLGERARAALGAEYIVRAEARRITLLCPGCAGAPMVDILLGRQTDGTEQRVRSGQTTVADLERLCQQRDPECRLERTDAGPAIGWTSRYRLGANAGSTLVLLRNGDMLTVRSLAATAELAHGNIARLMAAVVPGIVGR
jgi:hypothetical protein